MPLIEFCEVDSIHLYISYVDEWSDTVLGRYGTQGALSPYFSKQPEPELYKPSKP